MASGCRSFGSTERAVVRATGSVELGLPGSPGVSESAVAGTLVAPYRLVPEIGEDVAAMIVEAMAANMGRHPLLARSVLEGLNR